jgi:hypothetical protein
MLLHTSKNTPEGFSGQQTLLYNDEVCTLKPMADILNSYKINLIKYGSKCIWLILFYFSSAPWHCHSSAMVKNRTNVMLILFTWNYLPNHHVVDQLWNMQYIRSEKLKVVVSVVCPSAGPCCNTTILKFGHWLCLWTLQKSNLRCQQALSHSQGSVYPEWITVVPNFFYTSSD